jgi:hypothetical protein
VPGFPLATEPLAATGPPLAHQLWSAKQGVLPAPAAH